MLQFTAQQGLNFLAFYQNHLKDSLPVQVSYRLTKIALKVEEELKFFNEQLESLIKECGEKNEQGDFIRNDKDEIIIQTDKQTIYQQKIAELYNLSIDITGKGLLITDLSEIKVTNQEMLSLMNFIEEED